MRKKHLPAHIWNRVFGIMQEHKLKTGQVTLTMDLSKSTYYKKRKEYFNGGVLPRKPGNGAKRKYETKDYEQFLRDIVNGFPPVFGHERIWMEAKRLGAPFGQGVCYRMLKELGLLLPREKGRCRKHYEPLLVDGPNQIYLIDTTLWVVGKSRSKSISGWMLVPGGSQASGSSRTRHPSQPWSFTKRLLKKSSRRQSIPTMEWSSITGKATDISR